MHRVAWALQTAKGTGQKCEKPCENQGFLAERTGFEQPGKSLGTARFITPRDAKYDARKKHHSRRLETVSLRTIVVPDNRLLAHPHITGSFTRSRVNRLLAHLLAHMQFPRDLLAHLLAHHFPKLIATGLAWTDELDHLVIAKHVEFTLRGRLATTQ